MVRFLDFVVLGLAITAVNFWYDGNKVHLWVLMGLVLATNLLGFFRGLVR